MTLPADPALARTQLLSLAATYTKLPFQKQTRAKPATPARNAAVLLLFGTTPQQPQQLQITLLKRAGQLRYHAGEIAFPGGGQEPTDNTLIATALREAAEETSLPAASVDVLGTLPALYVPVSNNLVTPVLAWWRNPSKLTPNGAEVAAVFQVPLAELVTPANRATAVLRRGANVFKSPGFFLSTGNTVWGFTGFVLSGLLAALGWDQPWDANRITELN